MGGRDHDPSSDKTKCKTHEHQKRTEDRSSCDLGQDKETGRIDSHHLHCVDLLRDSHAAYFRRYVRTHLSRKNQGHHGGAELQDKTFPHHISDVHLVNDGILQVGSCLDDKHTSDEDRYHAN